MRIASLIFALLLGTAFSQAALAQPDRDSLIEAWEAHMASLPGTTRFEALGDGTYELHDTDLPYEGKLRVVGALVRSMESPGYETAYSHLGMLELELVDLPADRLSSQLYYYWIADRQMLHYLASEQRWVDAKTYQQSIPGLYSDDASFGVLTFMLRYGIWILLIGLIAFVFVAVARQTKKARGLMDETAAINQQARENLDRAQGMQDEVLAIARESRDLQSETNDLLRKLLDASQRPN